VCFDLPCFLIGLFTQCSPTLPARRVQRIRDAIAEHSTARCSVGNESPGLEALHSLIATQHQAEEVRAAYAVLCSGGYRL